MTDSNDDKRPPQASSEKSTEHPQMLNYLPPLDDPLALQARRRQRVVGCVLACLTVFISVFALILGTIPGGRNVRYAVIVSLFAATLLSSVTAWEHFVRRRVWFIQGVLIGLGVAALIEGACYAIMQ